MTTSLAAGSTRHSGKRDEINKQFAVQKGDRANDVVLHQGCVLYSEIPNFMLLAEIHGHIRSEVEHDEDYLTSSVFGHLRYIQPSVFWEEFLSLARGLPVGIDEQTLGQMAAAKGCQISRYERLSIAFWPSHPGLGTPDLLLCFSGSKQRPFVLLIEAKLMAYKSGTGEQDQLARYLDILADLGKVVPSLSPNELRDPVTALLYLTPRESISEILETARLRPAGGCSRLFRAQWQDIILAASQSADGADPISRMVLKSVTDFLRHRELEYFRGFMRLPVQRVDIPNGDFYQESQEFLGFTFLPISMFGDRFGSFFRPKSLFNGFTRDTKLRLFPVKHGGWM